MYMAISNFLDRVLASDFLELAQPEAPPDQKRTSQNAEICNKWVRILLDLYRHIFLQWLICDSIRIAVCNFIDLYVYSWLQFTKQE